MFHGVIQKIMLALFFCNMMYSENFLRLMHKKYLYKELHRTTNNDRNRKTQIRKTAYTTNSIDIHKEYE